MKLKRIRISRYRLRSRTRLNARTIRAEFEGALIEADGGYGCIHPWPELGDAPLDVHLRTLERGGNTALIQGALRCCAIDGAARREGRWLFEGETIPESHFTAPDPAVAIPKGFAAVKVKGGRDLEALKRHLKLIPAGMRIRIDFNGVLETSDWDRLENVVAPNRDRGDFLEDPVPFDEVRYALLEERTGWRMAVDRGIGRVGKRFIRVWKPALEERPSGTGSLVVTSYMDHPVGQLYAAWEAARLLREAPERVLRCGLVTQHLWEAGDPCVAALGEPSPVLAAPPGTGLGLDEELAALPWTPLC